MVNRGSCLACERSLWGRRSDARYCSATCRVGANVRTLRSGSTKLGEEIAELTDAIDLAVSIMDRKQRKEFERRRARRRSRHA